MPVEIKTPDEWLDELLDFHNKVLFHSDKNGSGEPTVFGRNDHESEPVTASPFSEDSSISSQSVRCSDRGV